MILSPIRLYLRKKYFQNTFTCWSAIQSAASFIFACKHAILIIIMTSTSSMLCNFIHRHSFYDKMDGFIAEEKRKITISICWYYYKILMCK